MNHSWVDDQNTPSTSTSPVTSRPVLSQFQSHSCKRLGVSSVFQLLAWREISPRVKRSSKRLWGEAPNSSVNCFGPRCEVTDARRGLVSWVEAESLWHLSAKYCPLVPPPRSTIAAAFSPDGKTLASTHGDHTVKIIDCQTGRCLKVLSGHRRTPWVEVMGNILNIYVDADFPYYPPFGTLCGRILEEAAKYESPKVRFHPLHSEILASGSLDYEVRLWDAHTAECIVSRNFYRPIASIAFHAQGEVLAVAAGHKLYIWHYGREEETSSPTIVLRTRRSLRAVHFHPHAAPFLLTAEVNDLNSPDSPMTLATSPGYLHYPPPAVFFANVHSSTGHSNEANVASQAPLMPFPCLFWPAFMRDNCRWASQQDSMAVLSNPVQQQAESSSLSQLQTGANIGIQHDYSVAPMEMSPSIPSGSNPVPDNSIHSCILSETENAISDLVAEPMEATEVQQIIGRNEQRSSPSTVERLDDAENASSLTPQIPSRQSRLGVWPTSVSDSSSSSGSMNLPMLLRSVAFGQLHQFFPIGDPTCWELPFLQGWLMGQSHSGLNPPLLPVTDGYQGSLFGMADATLSSSMTATGSAQARGSRRSGSRHRSRSCLMEPAGIGEGTIPISVANEDGVPSPGIGVIESELAAAQASLAAAAPPAELPCTVKLRIWPYNTQDPCLPLDPETCRLTVPHAVLCSEMGAHFSPCGRFLAACVACVLPHMELDLGLQSQMHNDVVGAATSPTRHPISAHQPVYELRIYSLEEKTFGSVLASRAIRAPQCLTSIQFSPTSEHILLAYGRRHNSLLRSIVVDGETTVPIYTILEVYRVSDMELVRVLPSAEDEVNVACFHPSAGGGVVYGTKEGKLRILNFDGSHCINFMGPNFFVEENVIEVPYALEC